ncbi:MAG: hypothetical protein J6I62_00010 [Selenomonadaceae bacterium]|nr:hypothetical protein [Selenomonadaceae bacterium]
MPFIFSKVNIAVNKEQELKIKSQLGKAIELVPGKSEAYLLTEIEDNCKMYLRGDGDTPIAFIDVSIFGNEAHYGYEAFTAKIAEIFFDTLHIPRENVYVNYRDITAWGVGGAYFDRSAYR